MNDDYEYESYVKCICCEDEIEFAADDELYCVYCAPEQFETEGEKICRHTE